MSIISCESVSISCWARPNCNSVYFLQGKWDHVPISGMTLWHAVTPLPFEMGPGSSNHRNMERSTHLRSRSSEHLGCSTHFWPLKANPHIMTASKKMTTYDIWQIKEIMTTICMPKHSNWKQLLHMSHLIPFSRALLYIQGTVSLARRRFPFDGARPYFMSCHGQFLSLSSTNVDPVGVQIQYKAVATFIFE